MPENHLLEPAPAQQHVHLLLDESRQQQPAVELAQLLRREAVTISAVARLPGAPRWWALPSRDHSRQGAQRRGKSAATLRSNRWAIPEWTTRGCLSSCCGTRRDARLPRRQGGARRARRVRRVPPLGDQPHAGADPGAHRRPASTGRGTLARGAEAWHNLAATRPAGRGLALLRRARASRRPASRATGS